MNTFLAVVVRASAVGLAAASAGWVNAGTSTLNQYSTVSSFLDASGPAPVAEDFETAQPSEQLLPTLTRPIGTFVALAGEPFANVYVRTAGATNFGVPLTESTVLTANGNEDWRLEFASPVRALGFDTYLNGFGPGTLTVIGAGGATLGVFTQSHDSAQIGFMGITSDTDIVAVRYTTVNGRQINTGVDNIRVRHEPLAPVCAADIGVAGGVPGHDGLLDNNDFIVFIGYFFASDPLADRGVQGGAEGHDGLFDNNDFIAFITQFFNGCG